MSPPPPAVADRPDWRGWASSQRTVRDRYFVALPKVPSTRSQTGLLTPKSLVES